MKPNMDWSHKPQVSAQKEERRKKREERRKKMIGLINLRFPPTNIRQSSHRIGWETAHPIGIFCGNV